LPSHAYSQTGESERLAALGYRMSGNSCYILCSIDCIDFYNTELKTSSDEVVQPHQQMIVGEYEHDYSKNNTNKVRTNNTDNSSSNSDGHGSEEEVVPMFTSIEHALNNCALDDIKDRLGYPKSVVGSASTTNLATTDSTNNTNSTNTTTDPTTGSNTLTIPPHTLSTNTSSLNANSTSTEHTLHNTVLTRFTSLGEIPNFNIRLHKATSRVKSLLFKLTNDIMVYQDKLVSKLKAQAESGSAGEFWFKFGEC